MRVRVKYITSKFETVSEAIERLELIVSPHCRTATLIWHDSLKAETYFNNLKPWQMINRIPGINILCRKVPFYMLSQKMQGLFPSLYNFVPETLVLPNDNDIFSEMIPSREHTYLVKPDAGSLGVGIDIIEPGNSYEMPTDGLYVAQKYINSYLIDNTKFDLRIYALITSVDPLQVYVYRDGVARFCAEKTGSQTKFSKLTNVALNKEYEGIEAEDISRLISDVLPILEKDGIDIQNLWKDIENVILLSIISSIKYIRKLMPSVCPSVGYSRCFQVLGFDILLDQNAKPWVIEVNYRPSLKANRPRERRMKMAMVCDTIRIAAPLAGVQSAVDARAWSWTSRDWMAFVAANPWVSESVERGRQEALRATNYHQVWPREDPTVARVIEAAMAMRLESIPGYSILVRSLVDGEA